MVIEQRIPIIIKNRNSENTVCVEDKLKANLNSAGPLVLISAYATKKNQNRIDIYTFVSIEQKILPNTAQFPKNRNS